MKMEAKIEQDEKRKRKRKRKKAVATVAVAVMVVGCCSQILRGTDSKLFSAHNCD